MNLEDKVQSNKNQGKLNLKRLENYLSEQGVNKITTIDEPYKKGSGGFDYLIELDCKKRVAVEFLRLFEPEEERRRQIPEVRAIDPPSQLEEELRKLLPMKNEQLDTDKGEKWLVIVSEYIWADKPYVVVSALSRIDELWEMENFDKIYLVVREKDFILIFSKELRNAWRGESFSADNDFLFPFQRWIFRLRELNAKNTFDIITKVINNKKPYELFNDTHAREEIVKLGNWLIEQKRFKDALWLIEKFIDDPDPAEPEEFKGEPEFNYHQQIINGKDPLVITSVRGHLAWVIQELALHRDYIIKAFEYTKKLVSCNNLYAKLQAIFPLIEISARRRWLEEHSLKSYQEFYNIAFDFLINYSKYHAIAEKITHVFFYFKDLTTEEALAVLDNLKVTSESAGLFVYYAIFRERHYKYTDGIDKKGFDPKPFKEILEAIIKNNDEKYISLREKIAWNFLSILDEYPEEIKRVSPYIDLFLQQPYNTAIYGYIEIIIKKLVDEEPDLSIRWFEQVLKNLTEYTETHEKEARNIALRTEEIIKVVAVKKPEKLIDLMQLLNFLWEKGSYIGKLKILFESFKLISNEDLKSNVKKKFIELYNSMKKLNPRLEKVDWY